MKAIHLLLISTLAFGAISESASAQLTCSDLEGASIFSSETAPVYLGFVGSEFAGNSINNSFGTYGNEFSNFSVRNEFGVYGSSTSIFSAQNEFATQPPKIIKDGTFIAYLSANNFLGSPSVSIPTLDSSCQFFASSAAPFWSTAGAPPSQPSIEATLSGLWYNPAQDGHGLSISVHSPQNVSVYWYTYDPFGNPIWILAVGPFAENRFIGDALYLQGMRWGDWNTGDREILDWGTIEIEFLGCRDAVMTYSSDLVYPSGEEFGSGEIPLVRLASVDGLECQ